ncbi:MAG: lipoate--protein ligase family protein [Candidatus Omnitrophica bacterium]|nr:lipoate--protein ligase family protein [Candidatus Omnitrophota bacterium]
MIIQDESLPDQQANLDRDDELLRLADREGNGEVLRFWESSKVFVVLGRMGREEDDVNMAACKLDGVAVLRRSSGGGTVVQGPGCLNFSLVLSRVTRPELRTITQSYRVILDKVSAGLKRLGVASEFRPVCDLVVGGTERKFSGNAQRRGRDFILHHGTILYGFDLGLVPRYLKQPVLMPEYRRGRIHADFVTNIPVLPEEAKRSIAQEFAG